MHAFDIIALAASAGGLKAMAEILGKRTALLVKEAREGDTLERGLALIAPPNRHLLVPRRTRSARSAWSFPASGATAQWA